MSASNIITDISFIAVFLLLGTAVRSKIPILEQLVLPASVIGGALGLLLGGNGLGWIPISDSMSDYAAGLIDLVFAGLFIGRTVPAFRTMAKRAGAQAAYAYFNIAGQIAIGLLVVVGFGAAGIALHPMFAVQLAAGFQGGPGTATALAPMIEKLGWSAAESAAVGEACAVSGLLFSILIGVILVNLAVARGLSTRGSGDASRTTRAATFVALDERREIGREVTTPEAASSLAFNFCFMALAVLGGKLLWSGIAFAVPPLKILPTFPFVLVAGLLVQTLLQKAKLDSLTDRKTIEALSTFALDILIVASLMSIELRAVAAYALPLAVMMALGLAFNLWQFAWLAPRILPGAWLEKALSEWGQSTGSTPQAMLLLRMVDPRLETDAAEAFALKIFLFTPVVFPLTVALMPAMVSRGPGFFLIVYCLAMVVILGLCRALTWQRNERRSLRDSG